MRVKNELPKEQIYWLCQIGGWFLYWLVLTFLNLLVYKGSNFSELWREQVLLTFFVTVGLVTTHAFRNFAKRRKWAFSSVAQLIKRIVASVFILSAIAFAAILLLAAVSGIAPISDFTQGTVLIRIFISVSVIISLWIAIYFSVQYFQNYRTAQMQQLQQESMLKEATLNKLRSQLNPHFVFNSLNSIRALVLVEPNKARESITALSNIFRKALQIDKQRLVDFKEELNIVKDYLSLEQIRYEQRLQTEFDIAEEAYSAKVPPLMLQTLVENGIKHGISHLREGGKLYVGARERDTFYEFQIINSGQISEKTKGTGYGIKNTEERLALLFGQKAKLILRNLDNNHVETLIRIPKT